MMSYLSPAHSTMPKTMKEICLEDGFDLEPLKDLIDLRLIPGIAEHGSDLPGVGDLLREQEQKLK